MSGNDDIRELLQQRRQARKQHRNEQGQFAKKSVYDIAKELQIDTADIRFRALASQEVSDPERAVLRLAVQMHHTQPTEADLPSQVSGTPFIKNREQRLQDEYERGSQNLYGKNLLKFKMQMREKGWTGS